MKQRARVLFLILGLGLTRGLAAQPGGDLPPVGFEALGAFDALPLLADWPAFQDSSYSRKDINQDAGNFLRVEPDGEQVLVDTEGPGVVYRIWSTGVVGRQMSEQCRLRFWFDGEAQPRLDLSVAELFGAKGSRWPFVPPLAVTFESGVGGGEGPCNLSYVPIPFAKRLKITGRNVMFYHVNYHRLPAGTTIESFSWEQAAKHRTALEQAAAQWQAIPQRPGARAVEEVVERDLVLAPGERRSLTLTGPGVIRELWVKLADPTPRALRSMVLSLSFESPTNLCVRVPLGDFFGSGAGEHRFQSLPCGMTADGYYAYWPMPFRRMARAEWFNEGAEPVRVAFWRVGWAKEQPPASAGYFHARYVENADVPEREDYHLLNVEGRGKLVGCNVTMQNARQGQGLFFLEGDEKIYVDGERWPSRWLGTGTEDYFNGAYFWNHEDKAGMARPLGGLTFLDWGMGRVCAYRWHFPDTVNFARSLKLDLEHGGVNEWPAHYASVTYYYLETPTTQPALPSVAERLPRTRLAPAPAFLCCEPKSAPRLAGRVLERRTFHELEPELESEDGAWVGRGRAGDRVEFEMEVPGEDEFQPVVFLAGGPGYATARASLGGKPLGEIVAIRSEFTPWISAQLQPVRLAAGAHTLILELAAPPDLDRGSDLTVALVALQLRPRSRFVDAWSVVGNFPCPKETGWTNVWEPESKPDPNAVYRLPNGQEARWREVAGGTVGLSGGDWLVAYGLTYVWSPDERKVALFIGKDDGLKLWVNEDAVFEKNTWSHAVADQFVVSARLRPGWNRMLVKCANWFGGWSFMVRVGDPERQLRFARKPE